MKKTILTLLAACFMAGAHAQSSELPKIIGDTIISSSGFKIAKGDELKMGVGTMNDGDFKFIRTNSASIFNYTSTTGYKGLANQANSLPRNKSGLKLKVIKVEKRGKEKSGFNYYAVLGGAIRYEVDIENAISTGEIIVPNEFKPKNNSSNQNTLSVADELKKFKELLDSGAITQAEYDAKKKQLLGL